MDKRTKKRIEATKEKLRVLRLRLAGAIRQADDLHEVERLRQEIAGNEMRLDQLLTEGRSE